MLDRIVDGERAYLLRRKMPLTGVTKSAAFRTIWDLGEQEYLLQRATLWVTRKLNRYTVEQAADLLGWDTQALRRALAERGVEPDPPASTGSSPPAL